MDEHPKDIDGNLVTVGAWYWAMWNLGEHSRVIGAGKFLHSRHYAGKLLFIANQTTYRPDRFMYAKCSEFPEQLFRSKFR